MKDSSRIFYLKIFFILIFVSILLQLFYWQIIRYEDLSILAEKQHTSSVALDAPRGMIYASDGTVLVGNIPNFLLYGLPKVVKDKEKLAEQLAEILVDKQIIETDSSRDIKLKLLKSDLLAKLSQDLNWVSLQKDIDIETKRKIDELKVSGLGYEAGLSRTYPEASAASHLLGFIGSDSLGSPTGYFGLEGFYNGELKGVGGTIFEERDAIGQPILTGKFRKNDPIYGRDLILHIDRNVQYLVEKKLKSGIEKFGAKSGSVIVMDPKTGAIIAMASFPNYHPGDFYAYPKEYYQNPVVTESYEPGSTFKVLVMSAAINEGLITPETKCDNCAGPTLVSGHYIRTWNNRYHPDTDMTSVIVNSDNTGMVFVSKKLGFDLMKKYIKDFGFGSTTQIDLQDESTPQLREEKDWYEIDIASAAFGQGIAVTPIQLIRAIAVIANKGYMMQPQIVKEIRTGTQTIKIEPKVIGQPISESTAKQVTSMMVQAVESGESTRLKPTGYKIAGKSGTAQIAVGGSYNFEDTVGSFVGFAPADDPRFIILVKYNEPETSIFGSATALPTFYEIAKELFIYFNIEPDN